MTTTHPVAVGAGAQPALAQGGQKPSRPVARYPGGKWLLAPWILEHMPAHRCYVEPFAGAGSVFIQKPRAYAEVLNDLQSDIVMLFRMLRDPVQALELEQTLRLTPYSRQEFALAYEETDEPLERMRRFLVRAWQGFNPRAALGETVGWRLCSDRRGTIPSHDWGTFPQQIARFTERLQGVVIEQCDAIELLARHDSRDTMFYVDPPYDETVTPTFRGYAHAVDHTALYLALAKLQGMVIVSGYHSPTYDTLYWEWRCVERRVTNGAEKGKSRRRTECLWLNKACQQAMTQLPLFSLPGRGALA